VALTGCKIVCLCVNSCLRMTLIANSQRFDELAFSRNLELSPGVVGCRWCRGQVYTHQGCQARMLQPGYASPTSAAHQCFGRSYMFRPIQIEGHFRIRRADRGHLAV